MPELKKWRKRLGELATTKNTMESWDVAWSKASSWDSCAVGEAFHIQNNRDMNLGEGVSKVFNHLGQGFYQAIIQKNPELALIWIQLIESAMDRQRVGEDDEG